MNSKSRYQFNSLLYELLLFFIISFILFPSHVKRIILCFIYSEDYQPSFINPSVEKYLQPACIVEGESFCVSQLIYKNDNCTQIPSKSDHPCNLEETKTDSKPMQSSTLVSITVEPCQQIVIAHDQPIAFQIKIKMKMFKPLKFPLVFILILLTVMNISLDFRERIKLQLKCTCNLLKILLTIFRLFMSM